MLSGSLNGDGNGSSADSSIKVAVRVRPLNEKEINSGQSLGWKVTDNCVSLLESRGYSASKFNYDYVMDANFPTNSIYQHIAQDLILSVMKGYHGTVFAYGQTSSGKTFTMSGNDEHPGIIPLAMRDVFQFIQENPDREFLLRVSYLEIYNEVIKDLLNPANDNLKIHETLNREIFVGNLTETVVYSETDIRQLMTEGEKSRHVGETNANEKSSRSHTILRMVVESRSRLTSSHDSVRISALNLVDLAGSERVGYTGAEGLRLKEAGNINKSLLSLGTVIGKLSEGGDNRHIPYRDSKLTRILQPALGGNSKTVIICTITPTSKYIEESISTLKFASRAKTIKCKPQLNEVVSDETLLKRYRKEIGMLRKQIDVLKEGQDSTRPESSCAGDQEHLLQERLNLFKDAILSSRSVSGKFKASKRRQTWFMGSTQDLLNGQDEDDLENLDSRRASDFIRRESNFSTLSEIDAPVESNGPNVQDGSAQTDAFQEEVELLKAQLCNLEEQLQDILESDLEKEAELQQYRGHFDQLKQRYEKQQLIWQEKDSRSDAEYKELSIKLQQLWNELEVSHKTVAELTSEKESLTQALTTQAKDFNISLDQHKSDWQTQQQALIIKDKTHEKTIRDLGDECQKLTLCVSDKSIENEYLQRSFAEQLNALHLTLNESKQQQTGWELERTDFIHKQTGLQQETESLSDALENAMKSLKGKETQLNLTSSDLESQKLAALQKDLEFERLITQSTNEKDKSDQKIAILHSELDALRTSKSQSESENLQEIKTLREQIVCSEKEFKNELRAQNDITMVLQSEKEDAVLRMAEIDASLLQSQSDREACQAELISLKSELASTLEKWQESKGQIRDYKAKCDELDINVKKLLNEKFNLEKFKLTLETERDSLSVELDARQDALVTATQNLSQATSELRDGFVRNEELQRENGNLLIQVENLQNTIGSNDDKAKGLAEIIARYEQELNGRDAALSKTDDIIKMLRKSLDDLEFRNNEQAKLLSDKEDVYIMFKQLHKDEIAGLNQTISELEMSNSNGVKEWAKHRDQMASDLKLLREQLVSTQQTNEDIEHRVIVTTKELNDRIENLEDEKTALVLDLKNANENIKHLQIELQSQTEKARNTLASERLEFEQEVQNLRSECIDMKQKLREASENETRHREIERQNTEEVKRLMERDAAATSEIDLLQKELESRMDDAQSTERMLRQDLTKAKHMIATKESELRDEIIDLQNEHEEQLRDSACRLSDTTKQLNELTEYRDILASKLDVSEKIFDTAQAQMQVVVEERNMRDKEIRALKSDIQELQRKTMLHDKKNALMEEERIEFLREIDSLKSISEHSVAESQAQGAAFSQKLLDSTNELTMANARITKLSEDLSKFQKVAKESIASQTEHDATDFVFDQQFKNLSIESRRLESKLRESEVVNVQQKKALEDLIQKMRNELHVSQEDIKNIEMAEKRLLEHERLVSKQKELQWSRELAEQRVRHDREKMQLRHSLDAAQEALTRDKADLESQLAALKTKNGQLNERLLEAKDGLEREIDEYLERVAPSARNNPSVLLESAQMELQKHKSDLMSLQRERQTWNMLHQSDQSQIRELEQTVLGLKRDVERLKRVASASATTTKAKINPMSNNVSENRENVAPGESKVSSDQKTQRLSPLKHTRSTVRRVPPPQEATKENTTIPTRSLRRQRDTQQKETGECQQQ